MGFLKAELTVALVLLVVAGLFGLVRSVASAPEEKGYALVGADIEPFRSDFNAAKDRVRAVLLVGPT